MASRLLWTILPSVLVVLAAWYLQRSRTLPAFGGQPTTSSSPTTKEQPADEKEGMPLQQPADEKEGMPLQQHAVYVIGDLHGDVHCARHWVNRTGLVQLDDEERYEWMDPSSSLVFMGDYLDKGIHSKQTLEFVKSLQEQFPQHVTALMGNHEMELLRDRPNPKEPPENDESGPAYFQLPYATVHPAEYLNFVQDRDGTDDMVIEALYNASLEVYGHGLYRSVHMIPHNTQASVLQFVPSDLMELVQERLALYQKQYLEAFSSGTTLGSWLEQLPVLAVRNDTIFCHGGISPQVAPFINHHGVDRLNELLAQNTGQEKLDSFLYHTREGQAIYNLLVYRGNHQAGACSSLSTLLPTGIRRLAVGHTPDDSVRIQCQGRFLAMDSALGRWFRNSGNEYCPGDKERHSSNGRAYCGKINEQCEGQIVRIRNGHVEVLE